MPKTANGIHYVTHDLRPPWITTGLPVIFNHGIGTNLNIWAEWVPVIAAEHPMVRFDMRGFGQSAIPPEDHRWSMEEMVGDLWDVADTAGSTKVHLAGESFGGTIVLAAAVARPERVASVTISNGSYKGDGIGQLKYWKDQFAEGGATGWGEQMMVNRFVPNVGDRRALAWFAKEQATTRPHVALGLGGLLATADLTEQMKTLDVPVSIVLPDSSPFVPVQHAAELHHLARNSRLRVVPGVRHGLPFVHARQEAGALVEWLRQYEGERADD
jgi:3-oxoadipate enol-lactonase